MLAAPLIVTRLLERKRRPDELLKQQTPGILALATSLVEVLESSRPVPLLRNRLRVDKPAVYDLVGKMRDQGGPASLLDAAEAVEDAVNHAMPLPLTDDVRLPRERVAELVRALRAAGA